MAKKRVMIPDVFIVDGTQMTLDGVAPTKENSIPFAAVFDSVKLIRKIGSYGVRATLVQLDPEIQGRLDCTWLPTLADANSSLVEEVLGALAPSGSVSRWLDRFQSALLSKLSVGSTTPFKIDQGVCLHHRDGVDWRSHCERSKIPNCLGDSNATLAQLLSIRLPRAPHTWVFYVGDYDIPSQFLSELGVPVVSRAQVSPSTRHAMTGVFGDRSFETLPRDLCAVLDYYMCSRLPSFIGNSVSTWSARQIGERASMASWYNSGYVPLADVVPFYVPIVYTYTEESAVTGKLLLQVSILSVRKHMPRSPVHVVYHGANDTDFRSWLVEHDVAIHDHHPEWRKQIERLRLLGSPLHSHLYAHAGNYLGTWQRIDVPKFISSEYCIFLDADTLVVRPFHFKDVGPAITSAIAFSSEMREDILQPINAGVALMNVPFLRATFQQFHEFIFNLSSPDQPGGPSDQGAYLAFYAGHVDFLDQTFNMKPYYYNKEAWDKRYILHFHGLKPNDFLQFWFSGTCEPIKCHLLYQWAQSPHRCAALQDFAKAAMSEGPALIGEYCRTTLGEHSDLCSDLFQMLVSLEDEVPVRCEKLSQAVILKNGLRIEDFPYSE
jgi:hypothetical protein